MYIQFLKNIFLFNKFSNEQLECISKFVIPIKLKKNQTLFLQGEPAESFFIVVSGKISVYRSSNAGIEQTLHIMEDRELVAEAAMFGMKSFPASSKALKETTVLKVPKDQFVTNILSNPELSMAMMASYSLKLRKFVSMIEYLSLDEVKLRIIKYFQVNCYRNDEGKLVVKLTTSKKELAQLLGTTPETLSRNFNLLKNDQTISEESKHIIVINNEDVFALI